MRKRWRENLRRFREKQNYENVGQRARKNVIKRRGEKEKKREKKIREKDNTDKEVQRVREKRGRSAERKKIYV
jgi:hypothetical protein